MNIYGLILLIALAEFTILVLVLSKFVETLRKQDSLEKDNEELRQTVGDLRLSNAIDTIKKNPYYSSLGV